MDGNDDRSREGGGIARGAGRRIAVGPGGDAGRRVRTRGRTDEPPRPVPGRARDGSRGSLHGRGRGGGRHAARREPAAGGLEPADEPDDRGHGPPGTGGIRNGSVGDPRGRVDGRERRRFRVRARSRADRCPGPPLAAHRPARGRCRPHVHRPQRPRRKHGRGRHERRLPDGRDPHDRRVRPRPRAASPVQPDRGHAGPLRSRAPGPPPPRRLRARPCCPRPGACRNPRPGGRRRARPGGPPGARDDGGDGAGDDARHAARLGLRRRPDDRRRPHPARPGSGHSAVPPAGPGRRRHRRGVPEPPPPRRGGRSLRVSLDPSHRPGPVDRRPLRRDTHPRPGTGHGRRLRGRRRASDAGRRPLALLGFRVPEPRPVAGRCGDRREPAGSHAVAPLDLRHRTGGLGDRSHSGARESRGAGPRRGTRIGTRPTHPERGLRSRLRRTALRHGDRGNGPLAGPVDRGRPGVETRRPGTRAGRGDRSRDARGGVRPRSPRLPGGPGRDFRQSRAAAGGRRRGDDR